MPNTTTAIVSDTLTERELLAWWDRRAPRREDKLFSEMIDTLERREFKLANTLRDLADNVTMLREDDLLFHVGTLCLLNGQRALWSQIYYLFAAHEGDMPSEDPFEFVEQLTIEARATIGESRRQAA